MTTIDACEAVASITRLDLDASGPGHRLTLVVSVCRMLSGKE
jgi:hypothetical protein